MRYWLALLLAMILTACATAPPAEQHAGLAFNDKLFLPQSERISAADVFALSPEMKRYLDAHAAEFKDKGTRKGLFDAL